MEVDNIIFDLNSIGDPNLVQQIQLLVADYDNQKKLVNDFANQLACAKAEIQELRAEISKNIEVINDDEVVLPHKRIKSASTGTKRPDVAPLQLPSVSGAVIKQKKVFQVIETDVKTVKKQLQDIKCGDFTIKQTSVKAPIKISIGSHDDIPKIRVAFQKSNISCHEFKLESEKSKCFIIRGLMGVTDADLPAIKDELINNGLPRDITLSLFITGYMRANPAIASNSLVKLILPPNCDTTAVEKIKHIDHVIVKINEFTNKTIMQCKNCQRFGHSAGGCMHQHRCVKCGVNHLKSDCPRSHDKSVKLFCCNCGGEHTANNLSICKFFQDTYVNPPVRQKTGHASVNSKAGHTSASRVNSKVTFSEAAKNGSQSNFSDLNSACQAGFDVVEVEGAWDDTENQPIDRAQLKQPKEEEDKWKQPKEEAKLKQPKKEKFLPQETEETKKLSTTELQRLLLLEQLKLVRLQIKEKEGTQIIDSLFID